MASTNRIRRTIAEMAAALAVEKCARELERAERELRDSEMTDTIAGMRSALLGAARALRLKKCMISSSCSSDASFKSIQSRARALLQST